MNNTTIKRVLNQNDLGIIITTDAHFKEHIYSQVNKANKMLGFMKRTLNTRSDQFLTTFRSLYLAYVRSHLDYASEIWSPKAVTLIKMIENVQRRATRLILPGLNYNERLNKLNLLPLVYQREMKDLTTFYKLKSGYYNVPVDQYFKFCSDKRLRSYSNNKLKINTVKTELFKATFFNRIPYLWNNLPLNIRNNNNLGIAIFKKQCTEFYKTKKFGPDNPKVTWLP